MPELPDVEALRRYLGSTALHKTIADVDIRDDYMLEDISPGKLESALKGRMLEDASRHGKYLFVHLDNEKYLVLHFGMTGDLKYFKAKSEEKEEQKEPEHTLVLFSFENDYHLAYIMTRKLGTVTIIDDRKAYIEEKDLGPDPLDPDFDFETFKHALSGRSAMIKSNLMNQSVIAGLGNVYVDEILFQTGVHPRKKTDELDEDTLKEIHNAMNRIIQTSIEHQANPVEFPDDYLINHREPGADCPRCGGKVERIKISGRSTYYCPSCQEDS